MSAPAPSAADISAFLKAVRADDTAAMAAMHAQNPQLAAAEIVLPGDVGSEPPRLSMLILAAEGNHLGALQWLIDKAAPLETRCNVMRATALWYAAREGHADAVELLATAGAATNTSCATGMTAATIAETRNPLLADRIGKLACGKKSPRPHSAQSSAAAPVFARADSYRPIRMAGPKFRLNAPKPKTRQG